MNGKEGIKLLIEKYLIGHLIDEAEVDSLTLTSPLISSGLIDSISTLQLVEYLEEQFNIEFKPHEVSEEHLDTIDRIVEFVSSRIE